MNTPRLRPGAYKDYAIPFPKNPTDFETWEVRFIWIPITRYVVILYIQHIPHDAMGPIEKKIVTDEQMRPVAVQIDFAVRDWLKKRGAHVKTARKRASTRKRT